MFRLCGYSKIGQSLVSLVLQTIILAYFTKDTSSGSSSCRLIIIITYISTVLVVVITLFEIVFQITSVDGDGGSTTNEVNGISLIGGTSSSVDMHNIGMTTITRIEEEVVNPFKSIITADAINDTTINIKDNLTHKLAQKE